MKDLDHRATMRVFADLVTPAFLTDRNLSDIMLLAAARLTIEHGVCPESCYPLTTVLAFLRVVRTMLNLDSGYPDLELSSLRSNRSWG